MGNGHWCFDCFPQVFTVNELKVGNRIGGCLNLSSVPFHLWHWTWGMFLKAVEKRVSKQVNSARAGRPEVFLIYVINAPDIFHVALFLIDLLSFFSFLPLLPFKDMKFRTVVVAALCEEYLTWGNIGGDRGKQCFLFHSPTLTLLLTWLRS